jgi:uncharacterized hydrophobic protein (TIGR00271 family)
MNDMQPGQRLRPAMGFRQWWSEHVAVSVDHRDVVDRVQEEGGWSAHYAFMILMSAGIAVLGLLLSSPAVVIGAMLISPLMGPIIALGFALATFDSIELRRSLRAVALGVALGIAFCALIVLLSPLQTVTSEIAARTRPNLFDLLVALFSGLAGTYAMIRGRHGAIVGVAIATALMPPLAVVGFGLATANWTVLAGSFLLFFTNLMTIAASAAVLARLYGFAPDLSPRQTRLQATLVIVILVALAVPLALSLRQIAWEAVASRQTRDLLTAYFGPKARISGMEIDFDAEPMSVSATVLTPRYQAAAERELTGRLGERVARPVSLSINQVRTENGDVEALEIASAKGAATDTASTRISERLALVAGVERDRVLIDGSAKRALVRAAPLPGADLAAYRALETRVAEAEPGWTVNLIPPVAPLPEIEFEGDEPSPAGTQALATAAWAARRLGLSVRVSGSSERVEPIVAALVQAGVQASANAEGEGPGVRLGWATGAAE